MRSSATSRAPSTLGLEADLVLFGLDPDVDDLRQVEGDVGVLGLQLVPAGRALVGQRVAQALQRLVLHLDGQRLPALEAEVHSVGALRHQWSSAGCTISVSTPPV